VPVVIFTIRLEATYWTKGFFNVGVDFERYFTQDDGPFEIYVEALTTPIVGRISRSANRNATPRIYGNQQLAKFFQQWHRVGDSVRIDVLSDRSIRVHSKAG